jgi:hypothetical protein
MKALGSMISRTSSQTAALLAAALLAAGCAGTKSAEEQPGATAGTQDVRASRSSPMMSRMRSRCLGLTRTA